MKVYNTEEKELVMELGMKWAANPNILVAVKAFGLKATVQPHVDFGVKLLGCDAMSIPGVYRIVQVGSHDKMGLCVVPVKDLTPEEPKTLTLELLKTLDPNDVQNEKSRGQIVVEVNYKPFKDDEIPTFEAAGEVEKAPEGTPETGGLLVIIIHDAQDVEGKYHTNPLVRFHFRGEERKTKTIKKNRDPRWEEEFQFVLEEPPTNDRVHVEVRSSSKKLGLRHPKETLGYVDINLADVVHNKRINERYHLIDSKNGTIQIEMQWRTAS
ncbi:UNVERIFIED_CONTAM: Synaptotagmin-2 [Sesamum latifolium]|uniref:Synaptotagmin-2 n=1 Tax=Sesamum latifolium TaxID=2727402 RepID=A0AAW2VRF3_9LAMI